VAENLARDVLSRSYAAEVCELLLIRWFAVFEASSFNWDLSKERVALPLRTVNPAAENGDSMAEAQISGPLDGPRRRRFGSSAVLRVRRLSVL
jgi:hypothetical protein